MNYTLKSGGLVSNAFGTIAVSYSLLHCLLVNGEPALHSCNYNIFIPIAVPAIEDNDEAKSIISGTLTGLFFKSTSGLQKCLRGGLVRIDCCIFSCIVCLYKFNYMQVGMGLSAAWALGIRKQEQVQHYI